MKRGAGHLLILVRIAIAVLALVLILFGVIAMIAPTPFGFVLVFAGLFMLAFAAPGFVRFLRRRWRWFDRLVAGLARRAPRWLRKALEKTAPGAAHPNHEP